MESKRQNTSQVRRESTCLEVSFRSDDLRFLPAIEYRKHGFVNPIDGNAIEITILQLTIGIF